MSKTERSAVQSTEHALALRLLHCSEFQPSMRPPDLYKSACMTWIDGIEVDKLHHLLTTIYPSTQLSPKVSTPYSVSLPLSIRSIALQLPRSISPTCQHHVLLFDCRYIKAYTHRLNISPSQALTPPTLYTSTVSYTHLTLPTT